MLTGQELMDLWHSYFVVTFVRNSYQRAVSSYRCAAGGQRARRCVAHSNPALRGQPGVIALLRLLCPLHPSCAELARIRRAACPAAPRRSMMMRNLSPAGGATYGWDDFCADPAGFAEVCARDRLCSK